MGLNVKDIQLHLYKVTRDSTMSSYSFMLRHPLISGASLVCLILYVFLSYIYNFLVYMSPFLVCAVIFIKIFWSSEQTQLKYVKRKEEQSKVKPNCPKIPSNRRPELLYKYPSQNATSRRRTFSDKNWDVYGGLEEKAKDLSIVFHNKFTKRNTENKWAKSFEKGESSLDNRLSARKTQVPRRQPFRSEPSMVDLVECGDLEIEKIVDRDDDDAEEVQEDSNKAIEWTEDDQKNLMYLGNSEMERNRRLENLLARRREKKLFKAQLEKGLDDKKPMAPVRTKRGTHLDSPKDFDDGFDMPDSAPSLIPSSPYDIPCDPSEDRPNLTRDSFSQEFASQNVIPFCRHESFSSGHLFPSETKHDHGAREHYSYNKGRNFDRLTYSRFRRHHTDKGTHDWLINQLIYNEGSVKGLQTPNLLTKEDESTHEEDEKCKTDMENMKDEKVDNDHETKSMSDQVSEPRSEKSGPRFPKPHGTLLSFPVTTVAENTTNINEALYDTVTFVVDKKQENMFLTHGKLCHTPTYSVASDLQVEVSEVGSLTSTVGENAETNSSTDRDSILYDGDIDRDASSGSEELWGASFHGGKEAQGVRTEGDSAEVNNSKDVVSSITPRHIGEENAADVSSLSSKSDVLEDTPNHATNSHHNFFGYTKHPVVETEAPQSSNSSHALDQLPDEAHSEKSQEWCHMPQSVTNEAHAINDMNNSAGTEQENTENIRNNEGLSTSVMRQESIDENSNYSVSSSPRSVLPEKTMVDEVSLSTLDQDMPIGAQQSVMAGLPQETLNSESPPDTIPQTIQPIMDDITHESHSIDFNHSQEQTNLVENSIEESNVFDSMNDEEVCNKKEQVRSKNDENNEDNFNPLNRQEATTESTRAISEITTLEDMNDKSRDLVDDKVPSTKLIEDDKNDKPSTSNNIHNKEGCYNIYDIFD